MDKNIMDLEQKIIEQTKELKALKKKKIELEKSLLKRKLVLLRGLIKRIMNLQKS